MGKVHFHSHVGSYANISNKAAQGLQSLRALLSEYDNENPTRIYLCELLAHNFHDIENGSDRAITREEAIQNIISTRSKCAKHQFDLKHAWCVENSGTSQTVFFESIRFLLLKGDTEWIRIPIAGRLEVSVTENKWTLKDAKSVITARSLTFDNSQLLARGLTEALPTQNLSQRASVAALPNQRSGSSIVSDPIPGVAELDQNIALPQYKAFSHSEKSTNSDLGASTKRTTGAELDAARSSQGFLPKGIES